MDQPPSASIQQMTGAASIAVLIPCFNEAQTIAEVIRGFQTAIPSAVIYVYDNNSSDETIERAYAAGATVRRQPLQGKGHVVRQMFSDIEADVYLMADGDATYDPRIALEMAGMLLSQGADMVVGRRVDDDVAAYRPGHRLGNALLTGTVAFLFGKRFEDMLSGYRAFSRKFVKSFPVFTQEFEIETEMTIHALNLFMPIHEIETVYLSRPEGSVSKLRTYRDGWRILTTIFYLLRSERPLLFFSVLSGVCMLAALVLSYPLIVTYFETGLVPRLPTAVLNTGLAMLSFLSITCGFILDSVSRGRRELRMLAYLAVPRWSAAAQKRGIVGAN